MGDRHLAPVEELQRMEGRMASAERMARRGFEAAGEWRHVADVLATELRKHGWGDFHYGSQGQSQTVLDALAVYERAVNIARREGQSGS